jgi:hypothetical protein
MLDSGDAQLAKYSWHLGADAFQAVIECAGILSAPGRLELLRRSQEWLDDFDPQQEEGGDCL